MCKIGIIKEIDKLGRIVIPKEIRDRYGIHATVEIVTTKDGILIRNPEYKLTKVKRLPHGSRFLLFYFIRTGR
ncbi:MAG: AbrB/MazE/SpoVT family DNA-binding domain-containing protein [Clostridia bacterium]|nr:AbrB/MazE/SpoVT family DNA-binding domain-containing protein [Clostridia bacterium]